MFDSKINALAMVLLAGNLTPEVKEVRVKLFKSLPKLIDLVQVEYQDALRMFLDLEK